MSHCSRSDNGRGASTRGSPHQARSSVRSWSSRFTVRTRRAGPPAGAVTCSGYHWRANREDARVRRRRADASPLLVRTDISNSVSPSRLVSGGTAHHENSRDEAGSIRSKLTREFVGQENTGRDSPRRGADGNHRNAFGCGGSAIISTASICCNATRRYRARRSASPISATSPPTRAMGRVTRFELSVNGAEIVLNSWFTIAACT